MMIASLLIGMASSAGSAHGAAVSVDEILKKSVQNIYSKSEEALYSMHLQDDSGKDTLRKMRVWYKREGDQKAKLLIKFLSPADIRDTGLLSIVENKKPSDQWLYIPAFKKIRRIKGGNDNESFLGSEFTIGDLTSIDNDSQRFAYSLTSEGKSCGSEHCYVLTGSPKSGVDSSSLQYTKKILEISKDNYLTHRVEFYNPNGVLEKVLEISKIHKDAQGHWLADEMKMSNQLTHKVTLIAVDHRDTSKTPADSNFTQSYLEKN